MKKKGIRSIYFGWWTVIYSGVLTGLGMGFTGGGMSDKFGPRWVIISGLGFIITGLILMNYIIAP